MSKKDDLEHVNKNTELARQHDKTELGKKLHASLKAPIDHKAALREVKATKEAGYYQEKSMAADKEWAKVRERAQQLLYAGQEGYDNFMSAMSKILQIAEQRNKALFAHNDILHFFYRTVPNWIGTNVLLGSDRMPGVNYSVDLNDDNTLNIQNLTRSNHDTKAASYNLRGSLRNLVRGNMEAELTKDEMLTFQALVVAWLETKHGYEPDASFPGKFIKKGTGEELTQKMFRQLMDECATDLLSHLRQELPDIDVNELPSPRM